MNTVKKHIQGFAQIILIIALVLVIPLAIYAVTKLNLDFRPRASSSVNPYCPEGTTCADPIIRYDFTPSTSSGNQLCVNNIGSMPEIGFACQRLNGHTSGPSPITTIDGKYGSGVRFDGGVLYGSPINYPTNTNISAMTFSSWVKMEPSTGGGIIISNGHRDSASLQDIYAWGMGISVQSGQLTLYSGTSSSTLSATDLRDNKWHNVSVVVNGTTATGYVDSIPSGTSIIPELSSENNFVLVIGGLSGLDYTGDTADFSNTFTGSIDELKVFNYARTPEQVVWDYAYNWNNVIPSASVTPNPTATSSPSPTAIPLLPDLTITSITLEKVSPPQYACSGYRYYVTVANTGKGPANKSQLQTTITPSQPKSVYNCSYFTNHSGASVLIPQTSNQLLPKASKSFIDSFNPAVGGTVTIQARADSTNTIPESNETNNTMTKTFTIDATIPSPYPTGQGH